MIEDIYDIEEIEYLLIDIEELELDCDGMSDQASFILEQNGIPHKRKCGIVTDSQTTVVVSPHCWLELDGGEIIDYRLQKWLGESENIPYGVFVPSERFRYEGEEDLRQRYANRDH